MDTIKEQVDDQRDHQTNERLAQALGISVEELARLDYDSTPINAGDVVTAYEYRFGPDADPEVLAKIKGLSPENTIQLGVYDLEKPDGSAV